MAICLKHSQQYNPNIGEYCPYCGQPGSNWLDYSTSEEWSLGTSKENKTFKKREKEKNEIK